MIRLQGMVTLFFGLCVWAAVPLQFRNISVEQGLSQGTIYFTLQDQYGFIWMGTRDGLNRFDGHGFRVYKHRGDDPQSLSGNRVLSMIEVGLDQFWVGCEDAGLNFFDATVETFRAFRADPDDPQSLAGDSVFALLMDRDDRLWVGSSGGLQYFETDQERFVQVWAMGQAAKRPPPVHALLQDQTGRIWIGDEDGLAYYAGDDMQNRYLLPVAAVVVSLFEDRDGYLWAGTDGQGMFRISPDRSQIDHYLKDADQPDGLASQYVFTMLEDRSGRFWIGYEDGGLSQLDRGTGIFTHYRADPADPTSLSSNIIYSLFEDRNDLLWIGTDGQGVNHLNMRSARFNHRMQGYHIRGMVVDHRQQLWVSALQKGLFQLDAEHDIATPFVDPDRPELENATLMVLYEDSNSRLWGGSVRTGLWRIDAEAGVILTYDPSQVIGAVAGIWSMLLDTKGNFWLGTETHGLVQFDPETETFDLYGDEADEAGNLSDDEVWIIFEDSRGRLWVGTENGGVNRLDPDSDVFRVYRGDGPNQLSHDHIKAIMETSQGDIWIGATRGLSRYLPDTDSFQTYTTREGLSNNHIYAILEDVEQQLWISSNRGLMRFDPEFETFRAFSYRDGLQDNEFNTGAYFKSWDGQVYFGGINGLNFFNPQEIQFDSRPPPIRLTGVLFANRPQKPGTVELPHSVHTERPLLLTHERDMVSFEFAALDYDNPKANRYTFRLVGYDDEWFETDARNRRATYTDLPAGSYTFRVRGGNSDGVWNYEGVSMPVTVEAPLWLRRPAIAFYVLLVAALLLHFLHQYRQRIRLQEHIALQQRRLAEQERKNIEHLQEVDRLKDEFLANTSIELRTPLNGIIDLATDLSSDQQLTEESRGNLALMTASGKRLANLVEDILDFSKLRKQTLSLNIAAVDLELLINEVLSMANMLTSGKNLALIKDVPVTLPLVRADRDRLVQILINLVDNAVRFTHSGSVAVRAKADVARVRIEVADTGIGIAPDKLETIFDSFEQGEGADTRNYGGAGLGLAITRQLIRLHDGDIHVRSTEGLGSVFSFSLPVAEDDLNPLPVRDETRPSPALVAPDLGAAPRMEPSTGGVVTCVYRLLVVDDEPVNCKVIANHLGLRGYEVHSVHNGVDALNLVTTEPFDLILLDLMMPGMSGYEICQKIRDKFDAHELPILFLSAKTRVSDLVAGFASGGNDYLTKPVAKEALIARVDLHLQLLDMNRTLEDKVRERTREASEKSEALVARRRQVMAQARLAALGGITSGMAFELRRPLDDINHCSERLLDTTQGLHKDISESEASESFEDIKELAMELNHNAEVILNHGQRAMGIVRSMMDLAREGKGEFRSIAINDLVQSFITFSAHGIKGYSGMNIEFNPDANLGDVRVEPRELGRVLTHLLDNARASIRLKQERTPDLKPSILLSTKQKGDHVCISVEDNGIGIPADHLDHIFTPFFTTKMAGEKNIGLGLSVCHDIVVDLHGGDLQVQSHSGQGAVFTIHLPIAGDDEPSGDWATQKIGA